MVRNYAKHTEEIRRIFEETYRAIQSWMESTGIKLAEHKTEALQVTSRKVENIKSDSNWLQLLSDFLT